MIVATACASPTVSPPPDPSAGAEAEDCSQLIDLFSPSGERLDLTGTWQATGDGPLYYVWQDADCIWMTGGFVAAEQAGRFGNLGVGTFIFDGHIRTDFTVDGRWATLQYVTVPGSLVGPGTSDTVTWDLEFDADQWTLGAKGLWTMERVSDRYVPP